MCRDKHVNVTCWQLHLLTDHTKTPSLITPLNVGTCDAIFAQSNADDEVSHLLLASL